MIYKEFLHYLVTSDDCTSTLLSTHFKESYLDFTVTGFSPTRTLYTATIDFYVKYRTRITSTQLESFLRTRACTDDQIKATLLLFEEVKILPSDKAFNFILDEIKQTYARHLVHINLDRGTDLLLENKIEKGLQAIKEGIFNAEEVLQQFSDEGSIQDSVLARAKLYSDIKNKIRVPGLPTGFPTFDHLTGGLKPGELIVVMAGSSEGKSTYMLNICNYVHMSLAKNVLFLSLELPKMQLERRYDSLVAGLHCNKLRDGTLTGPEEVVYKTALHKEFNAPAKMYIVDQPMMTPQMVAAKLMELESKIHFDLVIVDYLGLMKPDKVTGVGWQDIGNMALGLRQVARHFKVPLLTAMQVKQTSIREKSPKYDMTDIALSFAVIFHSDTVVSMKTVNPDILATGLGICELNANIAKCRDGSRGEYVIDASFPIMKMVERGGMNVI